MCLYAQPFADMIATVRMVEAHVFFLAYVHVTVDGLDHTAKHVRISLGTFFVLWGQDYIFGEG